MWYWYVDHILPHPHQHKWRKNKVHTKLSHVLENACSPIAKAYFWYPPLPVTKHSLPYHTHRHIHIQSDIIWTTQCLPSWHNLRLHPLSHPLRDLVYSKPPVITATTASCRTIIPLQFHLGWHSTIDKSVWHSQYTIRNIVWNTASEVTFNVSLSGQGSSFLTQESW